MPGKPTYEELEQRIRILEQAESERRLAEVALQESENRFRRLFNYHSEVMLVIDPMTGAVVDANEAAANFYGWSVGELKRMSIQQINTLTAEALKIEMQKALSSDRKRFEFRHRTADGSIRDVEVFSNRIEIAGKDLLYSIVHDVTDRRLADEALLDSEKRFRAAFQGSPVALAITTQEGGVWTDVNQAELDLFGYTREELIGNSSLAVNLWVDPVDRQRFVDAMERDGEVRAQAVQLRRKDGSFITTSVSANSLILKGVKHILFATEDITERRMIEERTKQNLLEKEILLREIHHRVKNNLAVISSLLGLQANRSRDMVFKEKMDACQQRIKSMAMVHEKMCCSQNISRVDFSDYISSILQDLTTSCIGDMKNIVTRIFSQDVLLDIATATPCALIINELITNAVKHAFSETIRPELSIFFEKVDKTYTLTVQDNGAGLPADFGSLSTTDTLGLMLVRALTRQLRGAVHFHSDASVRQGTTVTVTFTEK